MRSKKKKAPAKEGRLSKQHKEFALQYVKEGRVYESAIAAGYSEGYAKTGAYKLLEKVSIRKYIDELMATMQKPTIAKAEEVLEYFTKVMRGEEKDAFGLDASLADRNKAAENLGKRYGLFVERREHTGKNGGPIEIAEDVSNLSDDELEKELAQLEKFKQG